VHTYFQIMVLVNSLNFLLTASVLLLTYRKSILAPGKHFPLISRVNSSNFKSTSFCCVNVDNHVNYIIDHSNKLAHCLLLLLRLEHYIVQTLQVSTAS